MIVWLFHVLSYHPIGVSYLILSFFTARINAYDEITAYNNDSYSIDTYSGEWLLTYSLFPCLPVCLCVCMHVCMYVCMYVCMHVCICIYLCMYAVCMYIYICMYVCMYVYVSIYVCLLAVGNLYICHYMMHRSIDDAGVGDGCLAFSHCNYQGQCDYCYERCHCYRGFGSRSDLLTVGRDVQPDCSSSE